MLEEMKDIIQTAVIATHDMQLVCQWADRIVVLCYTVQEFLDRFQEG